MSDTATPGISGIPRPAAARAGVPPAWSALPESQRRGIGVEEVRRVLSRGPAPGGPPTATTRAELPPSWDPRPAAVLCLLFDQQGEANVVLTRRSRSLREHRGEVAFPGGRLLPDESPVDAALREAREEIGVDPAKVEILGQLTPLGTISTRQSVQCFVGSLTHTGAAEEAFVANASEVERVFWVPLAHLAMEGVYHEELWPAPEEGGPAWRAVPFFQIGGGDVVWGATGRLLTELLTEVLVARIRHRGK